MEATAATPQTSEETLTLINNVLDFIRGNLDNIARVWGRDSNQYEAASKIMEQYLDENLKKVDLQRSDLGDLMSKLSLQGDSVDVERQCGVPLPDGMQCAKSLTCKSHSMGAKRSVPGRSLPYDILLAPYQKKDPADYAVPLELDLGPPTNAEGD